MTLAFGNGRLQQFIERARDYAEVMVPRPRTLYFSAAAGGREAQLARGGFIIKKQPPRRGGGPQLFDAKSPAHPGDAGGGRLGASGILPQQQDSVFLPHLQMAEKRHAEKHGIIVQARID